MIISKKASAAIATKSAKLAEAIEACAFGPIIIVIDPGHGDIFDQYLDPGAVSGEFKEKDLALDISTSMRSELQKHTELVKAVYLTREGDMGQVVRFKWRIAVAKEKEAKIFISIHLDSAGPSASGHSVLYEPTFAPGPSAQLGQEVSTAYTLITARKSPVIAKRLAVLKLSSTKVKAGILIETGFITNDSDRNTIKNHSQEIGTQISNGVLKYIRENKSYLCQD